ncbi:SDR family oxidoreductase [Mucilaginibacter rubeus]|uniref:SDR family oxidoreductase n=1 Tax=Mucilaginibacter rubeus TaxID=2027860 RepID=A0AAE6MHZ5_9SPHI|nr:MULTISPECIES: SDR family oxidoreductase [Mucilaginibacter]QEM03739.1 SDR family oxidoreductase [Mucilaginibacter rubeus]QEM16350.1 SDR family oxidoreductase [Mucilaginibacter gossypii]QTE40883.1 SDR family oxidoreductase [Mucilaginibacter rubeus]QTE47486.1 SDR family oxidoreductase [Mucilaginibacter rubeus]QTE58879.1 SDR family oxidoreductase [Mucilaginibacter rubeus]
MKDHSYHRSLKRKNVVVIGADSLIGQATAIFAAAEGAHVTAVCRKLSPVLKNKFVLPFGCNMKESELRCDDCYKELFINRASLDHMVMVLPEHMIPIGSNVLPEVAERHFITTCFISISAAIKYALPLMGPGCSITICSVNQSPDPCIKDILPDYTKAMAVPLAPVRLNCVTVGLPRQESYYRTITERPTRITAVNDVRFFGSFREPGDVALALIYLIKHPFATGENLVIDEGRLTRRLHDK